MKTFKYELYQLVKLTQSDECGTIVARAEYVHSCPSYLVRYKAGNGCQVEEWWNETAIEAN